MDDYPYDLGPYTRKITTGSPAAQLWFVRGLNWCFGFHHEEAIQCFEAALAADPDCAMAHWGIAYALVSVREQVESLESVSERGLHGSDRL